jgi:hypothetical protein
MPTMVLTIRRFNGGQCLVTYHREAETGHVLVTTPVNLWRSRRKRAEVGGAAPRPFMLDGAQEEDDRR